MLHRLFSSCGKWELLFVAVWGVLIAGASLVAEHGFWGMQPSVVPAPGTGSVVVVHRLSCSAVCEILPGPGIEPVCPALAGGLFTTQPPGKPLDGSLESKIPSKHVRKAFINI